MKATTILSQREQAADMRRLIDAQAHALFDELAVQTQAPRLRADDVETPLPILPSAR